MTLSVALMNMNAAHAKHASSRPRWPGPTGTLPGPVRGTMGASRRQGLGEVLGGPLVSLNCMPRWRV
eukprot:15456958-Alexandrium_andersonii.AAC.1